MPYEERMWDPCWNYVNSQTAGNDDVSWERIRYMAPPNRWQDVQTRTEEDRIDFLQEKIIDKIEEAHFPRNLAPQSWFDFVDAARDAWERRLDGVVRLPENGEDRFPLPVGRNTCWQRYRYKLLERKHFPRETVDTLEFSCQNILNNFKNEGGNKTQGMFIGNVQSGKTAHMAGLIAMAADHGFNFFIVLSGTIENLRVQNSDRLIQDLSQIDGHQDEALHMNWIALSHLRPGMGEGQLLHNMALTEQLGGFLNTNRYLTVCLKNSTRLRNLLQWLQEQNHADATGSLKILLIDDECDQASVNTEDIQADEEERTKIYNLIHGIVNHQKVRRQNNQLYFEPGNPYKAMNYIAYSATPFGNLLNDAQDGSLYPFDYITTLAPSASYWSPERIFGLLDNNVEPGHEFDNKPFLNQISQEDRQTMRAVNGDRNIDIPESLQDAVLWFICAGAVRRYWNQQMPERRPGQEPVSMLIHTSNAVAHHENVALSIWRFLDGLIQNQTGDVLNQFREVYDTQTQKLPFEDFEEYFPGSVEADTPLQPYPAFDQIEPLIQDILRQGVQSIHTNEEGNFQYTRGIHLCVDNSSYPRALGDALAPNQEGVQGNPVPGEIELRIKYPNEDNLGYVPLFLVIGGNTLSRGLTLKGLVCSYFLRGNVRQGDSLMQMGRWFGYRVGYENLPRIWVEEETLLKFQFMTMLDNHLRTQIRENMIAGRAPRDCSLQVLDPRGVLTGFNITAMNKQQAAVIANYALAGKERQLTTLKTDIESLRHNADLCTGYIQDHIRQFRRSVFPQETAIFKNNTPWEEIRGLLDGIQIQEHADDFRQQVIGHVNANADLQGNNWTVVVAGICGDNLPDECCFLCGDFRIGIARKTVLSYGNGKLKFKTIRQGRDFLADLDIVEDIPEEHRGANTSKVQEFRSYITTEKRNHSILLLKPLFPLDQDGQLITFEGERIWSAAVYFKRNNYDAVEQQMQALEVGNMGQGENGEEEE